MIPISLEMKGVYSYQDTIVKIDFEKLSKSYLFGIFGEVGSGKSTILEAITLALYGETERLNLKDNRNYNLMNLRSKELLIDFQFKSENDKLFRFTKKATRNRRKFNEVKKMESFHYEYKDGKWIPTEKTAEEIIGLNYDNFKRTIIIHQDKFKEFIQLTSTARSEMLKDIFGLHKYDLSKKASILKNKNDIQLTQVQTQLQELGDIDETQIESKEKELKLKDTKIKELSEELSKLKEQEQKLESLRETYFEIQKLKKEEQTLLEQSTYYENLQKQIEEYEMCKEKFYEPISKKNENLTHIHKLNNELKNKTLTKKNTKDELNQEKELFVKIKEDYDNRFNIQTKQDDYNKIIQIKESNKMFVQLSEQVEELEKKTKVTDELIKRISNDINNIKTKIKENNEKVPDTTVLIELERWFTQEKNLKSKIEVIEKDIQNKEAEREKNLEHKQKIANSAELDLEDSSNMIKNLETKIESSQKDMEQLNSKILGMELNQQLNQYVEQLKSGEACPLCGSKEHPRILNIENLKLELENLKVKKNNLEQKTKNMGNILFEMKSIQVKEEETSKFLTEKIPEKESLNEEYDSLLKNFHWDGYSVHDEDKIQAEHNKGRNLLKEIKKLEAERENLEKKLEIEKDHKEKSEKNLNEKHIELSKLDTRTKEIKNHIKIIPYTESIDLTENVIRSKIKELESQKKNIEKTYESKNKKIMSLENNFYQMDGEIQTITSYIKETNNKLRDLETELENLIQSSDFQKIEDVEEVLKQKIDIESTRKKIVDYHKNLDHLKRKRQELESKTVDQTYEASVHENVKNQIQEESTILETFKKESHELLYEIKTLKTNLTRKIELEEHLNKLQNREKAISELKNLFHAQGFVNYVSRLYLLDICNSANDRFYKLTNQKLKLELTKDNSFQVRDYINNGEVRSVKTLSGGQTFQAALSLALALSDRIQKLTSSKENFFFIDEGFGSLDKESLTMVFETLKSLKKENRIVGIISHVEELQYEIPLFIKVKNDKISGSKVVGSWE